MAKKQEKSQNKKFEISVRENAYLSLPESFSQKYFVFGRYTIAREILDEQEDSESDNIHYLFDNETDANYFKHFLHYKFALVHPDHASNYHYLIAHGLEHLSQQEIEHDYGTNLGNSPLLRLKLNKERHDFIESQIKPFKNTSECLIETFKNSDNRDNFHLSIDSNTITIKEKSLRILPKLAISPTPNSDAPIRYLEIGSEPDWPITVDFLYIQNQREMAIDESTQLKKMDNQHFYLFSSELDYLNFFFFLRDTVKQLGISDEFFNRFSNQKTFGHEVAVLEKLAHYRRNTLSENNPATTLIAFEATHQLHRLIRHILNNHFETELAPGLLYRHNEAFPREPKLRFFSRKSVQKEDEQDDENPIDSPLNNPDKHL